MSTYNAGDINQNSTSTVAGNEEMFNINTSQCTCSTTGRHDALVCNRHETWV